MRCFLALPLLALAAPAEAQIVPPATTQMAPVDATLLAKAQPIAAAVIPDGVMARMMGPMMQQMIGPMVESMTKMPVRELMKAGGMDAAQADQLRPATIEQVMAIVDPAYQQRMRIIVGGMMPALGKFMGRFEPDMREGMAGIMPPNSTRSVSS
jgi:hypothetical protein